MIKIIKNTKEHAIFKKYDDSESWFNHDCSDENLLKHLNREGDTIKTIQFEDQDFVADVLNVYFTLSTPKPEVQCGNAKCEKEGTCQGHNDSSQPEDIFSDLKDLSFFNPDKQTEPEGVNDCDHPPQYCNDAGGNKRYCSLCETVVLKKSAKQSQAEPKGDLKQAIEDIKHFSHTHLDWAEHFEKNPDKEKEHLKTGEWSSAREHREIVSKYDNVLKYLYASCKINKGLKVKLDEAESELEKAKKGIDLHLIGSCRGKISVLIELLKEI